MPTPGPTSSTVSAGPMSASSTSRRMQVSVDEEMLAVPLLRAQAGGLEHRADLGLRGRMAHGCRALPLCANISQAMRMAAIMLRGLAKSRPAMS